MESKWLDIRIHKSERCARLGTFYRAGTLSKESQDELDLIICDKIRRNCKPGCIFLEDYNLKSYAVAGTDNLASYMFKMLFEEELFMLQNVTEATRLNSILELVFSDEEDLVGRCQSRSGHWN